MIQYGLEIEDRIARLTGALSESGVQLPARWTALKLLENDPEVSADISRQSPAVMSLAQSVERRTGGHPWRG